MITMTFQTKNPARLTAQHPTEMPGYLVLTLRF